MHDERSETGAILHAVLCLVGGAAPLQESQAAFPSHLGLHESQVGQLQSARGKISEKKKRTKRKYD